MTNTQTWYLVKESDEKCEIVGEDVFKAKSPTPEHWGPFASQEDAIARRIGLIRAGKCQPQ
jgi:hypothetical protein